MIAWTILFITIHDILTSPNFTIESIIKAIAFFSLFIFLAKKYYQITPTTIHGKTLIISYNLAVIPIVFANIYYFINYYIFDTMDTEAI